jgi:phosphate/sulfate permease
MTDRHAPTPGETIIMVSGVVMLLASFLDFSGGRNAWGRFNFPIATLLPIYATVMAVQVVVTTYGNVNLRGRRVLGYTWDQLLLLIGLMAGLMALAWITTDVGKKQIGLWVEVFGGIALAVGAVRIQRERRTGAFG